MEAASTSRLNLGLGVGMDTVASVSLSPLPRHGHPSFSSPAPCRPGPRLLKQRSLTSGASNLPSAAPRSRPRPWSSSGAAAAAPPPPPPQKEKEKDLVFVAGATGRVGSRAVRELIKLGFRVRAAVRSAERASSLVQVLSLLAHQ